MFKSLWIDELGTYWTISGTLSETVQRATDFQGQSAFTYVLIWAWNAVFAPSDFGLRILPALFGLGTIAGIFSIAKRIVGPSAGWYSVAVSVSLYEFRFLFVELRPYAFGLFFLVLATRLLIAWEDRPAPAVVVGYVLATAASIWSVYYFGFALIGHLLFVLARRKEGDGRPLGWFAGLVGAVAALCVPLLPQLVALSRRADTLQFSESPLVRIVLGGLIPLGMTGAWLVIVLVAGVPRLPHTRRSDKTLLVWLLLAPPTILYILTVLTDLGLWTMRYKSASLVGFVLAASLWIAGYETEKQRTAAILILVVVGLLIGPPNDFASGQDWRSALSYADSAIGPDGLVILNSGLVEGMSLEVLEDPIRSQFLAVPLSRYPVRQQVLLSPFLPPEETFPYLVKSVEGSSYGEIAVVSRTDGLLGFESLYLALGELGFEQVDVMTTPGVKVFVFRHS